MSENSGLANEQNDTVREDPPEAGHNAGDPSTVECYPGGREPQGFLEIIYGVLFEPVNTMRRAAENPPLVPALIIVTMLSLLGTLMGMLTFARILSQGQEAGGFFSGARALVPVGAFIILVFSYIKWFGYSAVLHLAADLLGGRGRARGVFAAVGLAGLPYILLVPFQFLGYWYSLENTAVNVLLFLAGMAVWLWSSIILVIGIREVYRLSTGYAVLVFFIPVLALLLILILLVIALAVTFSAFPLNTNIPGYF